MVMMCVRNGEEVSKDKKEEKDRKRVQNEGDVKRKRNVKRKRRKAEVMGGKIKGEGKDKER
jgi:hypothetical protein